MVSRPTVRARRISTATIAQSVVGALFLVAVDAAHAINIAVGPQEVIYTKSKRISSWPDGSLGPVPLGNGLYDFYGATGSNSIRTTGTLTTPGSNKKSVKIEGVPKKKFDYLAGGPIYRDPTTGTRIMLYHAEVGGKKKTDFHAYLGLAVATDASGLKFRDLGTIIDANARGPAEIGGGAFAVLDGYFNVYFKDWLADGSTSELAVARASLSDVVNNALAGQGTSFNKYYNGGWTEPGLGGKSSYLETSNAANAWTSVSYNDYLDQLVMVSSQWVPDGGDLYMAFSPDGINWSPRQAIAADPGEQFYPTIIGTGPDPTHSDQSFYVYYTDSKKGGWSRWKDAQLIRKAITIDPYNSSPVQPLGGPGDPGTPPPQTVNDWAFISGHQADFQGGTPSTGWKYAWNPKGKLGKSANYVPLLWSETAQAYNTTGAATQVPGKKSHHDDYLHLTADGGHPGDSKYLPMAGYTIQGDDGAGLYRIADSSILRTDSLLNIKKEDGLQVQVYVNDKQVGAALNVAAGLLTSFDRELGQLNIGDTVWVMISAMKHQTDDAFSNFDFSLQKWSPVVPNQLAAVMNFNSGLQMAAVPEPTSAVLLLAAMPFFLRRRTRRSM
jgi:hypothetical protein